MQRGDAGSLDIFELVEVGGAVDEVGIGVAVGGADERRTEPWNEPLRYELVARVFDGGAVEVETQMPG